MLKRTRSDTDISTTGVAYFPSEPVCDDGTMEVEELSSSVEISGNVMKSLSKDMSKLFSPGLGTRYLWTCGPSPPPRSVSFASSDEGSDLMTPMSSSRGSRKRRSKVARPRSFRQWRQSDDEGFEFPHSLPPRPQWDKNEDSPGSPVKDNRVARKRTISNSSSDFGKNVRKEKNTFVSGITDEDESEIDIGFVNNGSNSSSSRSRSRCSSSGSMSGDL